MGLFNSTKDNSNSKISKIQNPTVDNLAKINSDGELEDSGSSIADIQAALDLKANSNDLRQDSTFFVDDLVGSNSNDGKSLDKPFATVAKGIVEVESYSILKINGQGNKSGTASFSSSQYSITVDISPAITINGTISLVSGNTYMSFKNGKISATINDFSGGRTNITNVDLENSTINFENGNKTIKNCSTPNVINLTGPSISTRAVLRLENISGGSVPINIGTNWDVYVVNSRLEIGTNNGNVYYEDSSIIESVLENQSALNAISNDGLYALNFANPSISGLSVTKGDIISKVGSSISIAFPYTSAPATISVVKTTTEQNTYHKEGDGWSLTKNKLNPVENGTANNLVSQDAGGKLEPTTINKNDVALKDPNATANNIPKYNNNGQLIDGGIKISDINNQKAIWAYQDFNAGAITGTSVTLTTGTYTEISGSDFNTAKIINSAFIVRSDNIEKYAYAGAIELFSSKIKVSNISGASVTLSNAPHSSYPVRIYFQYSFNGYPDNYSPIKKILSASALDELNPIIATQEEVDEKLDKSNNLNDVANNQTARNNLLGNGNTNDVITRNSSGNWVASASAAGISDAPLDGKVYGRQSGNWVETLKLDNHFPEIFLTSSRSAYDSANSGDWIEITAAEYADIQNAAGSETIGTLNTNMQSGPRGSFMNGSTVSFMRDRLPSQRTNAYIWAFSFSVGSVAMGGVNKVKVREGNNVTNIGSLPASSKTNSLVYFIKKDGSGPWTTPYIGMAISSSNADMHYQVTSASGYRQNGDYTLSIPNWFSQPMTNGYDPSMQAIVR